MASIRALIHPMSIGASGVGVGYMRISPAFQSLRDHDCCTTHHPPVLHFSSTTLLHRYNLVCLSFSPCLV